MRVAGISEAEFAPVVRALTGESAPDSASAGDALAIAGRGGATGVAASAGAGGAVRDGAGPPHPLPDRADGGSPDPRGARSGGAADPGADGIGGAGDSDGEHVAVVATTAERFARAAWTHLSEPGDGDAGLLVAALGPVEAWHVVAERVDPDVIADRFTAAETGVTRGAEAWAAALKRWMPRHDPSKVLRSLGHASRFGMHLLVPGDPAWPTQLDDLLEHAPHAIWARGDVARLRALDRSVALVGARAATGYGEHVTVEAASGLADRGFAVVSGGAYGIDGMAHRAALASRGITIAVLAGGLDVFYPTGHEQLLSRIVDRGVVLGEVPPGTAPTKWRFLQRNRLIAALAGATVVVEAGWRSGSLNTAHHAGTLARPLGAVPGPVTSAASAGCHRLLRENAAVCVTTAEEMAELVGVGAATAADDATGVAEAPADPTPTRLRVLDAISDRTPRRVERIAELSGLAVDRVRAELGLLHLDGQVGEGPAGGWVRRR